MTFTQLYHSYLRHAPENPDDQVTFNYVQAELDQGLLSIPQVEANLQTQAMPGTIPALVLYDLIEGVTPTSGGLDFLTNFIDQQLSLGWNTHNAMILMAAQYTQAPLAPIIDAMSPDQFASWLYAKVFGPSPMSVGAHDWIVHQDLPLYSAQFGNAHNGEINLIGKLATIGGITDLNLEGLGLPDSPNLLRASQDFLHKDAQGQAQWGQELFHAVADDTTLIGLDPHLPPLHL